MEGGLSGKVCSGNGNQVCFSSLFVDTLLTSLKGGLIPPLKGVRGMCSLLK